MSVWSVFTDGIQPEPVESDGQLSMWLYRDWFSGCIVPEWYGAAWVNAIEHEKDADIARCIQGHGWANIADCQWLSTNDSLGATTDHHRPTKNGRPATLFYGDVVSDNGWSLALTVDHHFTYRHTPSPPSSFTSFCDCAITPVQCI